jgi:hypothetical protein
MSYVYADRTYDQLVNAHVQVYDRWASPFSISIMHAHLKKKQCTAYIPGRLQSAKNILMLPRPGGLQLGRVFVVG